MSAPIPISAQCKTLKISVTNTASTSTALPAAGNTLRVVNEGTNAVFISVGSGTQTATVPATSSPVATCTPILSGEDACFSIPSDSVQNISAITATSTATIYVSVGEGV